MPALARRWVVSSSWSNATRFAALVAGAPFRYADWGEMVVVAIIGNVIGGVGLVTVLRLMQMPHKVIGERDDNDPKT